jgi:AraC-like DNA-binding protein
MDYSCLYENKRRGTAAFPLELYLIDESKPRYQMPLHWHLEYELILVKEGTFTLTLNGKTYVLTAGQAAWVGEGIVHGGFPENCVYQCLVFDLHALINNTPLFTRSGAAFTSDPRSHTAIFDAASPEALNIAYILESVAQKGAGSEWTTMGLIWQLIGRLMAYKEPAPLPATRQIKQLKHVLSYIREHYEEPISLTELAGVAGMAPRYFCRAFAAMTGKTPIAYLNYYRIEQACERLLLTDERITDIAFSCGFNDAGYFTKAFIKQKDVSPTQYRKTNK